MKFDPSPTAIWKKYERDRDYKRSIGLYDRVRRNEAFYLGRQWEGLRAQSVPHRRRRCRKGRHKQYQISRTGL